MAYFTLLSSILSDYAGTQLSDIAVHDLTISSHMTDVTMTQVACMNVTDVQATFVIGRLMSHKRGKAVQMSLDDSGEGRNRVWALLTQNMGSWLI